MLFSDYLLVFIHTPWSAASFHIHIFISILYTHLLLFCNSVSGFIVPIYEICSYFTSTTREFSFISLFITSSFRISPSRYEDCRLRVTFPLFFLTVILSFLTVLLWTFTTQLLHLQKAFRLLQFSHSFILICLVELRDVLPWH